MASAKPVLIFTLVHGTFSKGAPWVIDDSDPTFFRRRLRDALEPEFEVQFDDKFDWGHDSPWRPWDNTLSARKAGTEKLVGHLTKAPDGAGARRYLVAHSHGGNVALQALKDEAARRKVAGLICLSTPFLFSKRAKFRRDLLGISAVVLGLATYQWSSRLPLGLAIGLWSYTAIYVLMVILMVFFCYEEKNPKIDSHLAELKFLDPGALSGKAGMPSLWLLRVPDDEVGTLMRFSYRVGGVVRKSWQRVNQVGGWLLGGYMALVAVPRMLSDEFGFKVTWADQVTPVFDRFMTPITIFATAVLMAMAILRMTFAFDSVRWVPVVDTWSEPIPWEGEKVQPVSLERKTRGLFRRHTGIYGPATAKIADLIRGSSTGTRGTGIGARP